MPYADLLRLYFDRSNALQNYWTLYVVVIGGLLAFSTLRQRPDLIKVVLVSLLYVGFAYKNLSALGDVTAERLAILHAIQATPIPAEPVAVILNGDPPATINPMRPVSVTLSGELRAAMNPTPYAGVRHFHVGCDVLTLAAVWVMEWRRRDRVSVSAGAPNPAA